MLDNPERIITMLRMQEELEVNINGWDWRNGEHDFPLAIHMECAEIIEHIGWKWWMKQPEYNETQVHLELIDIWHFVLGHNLVSISGPELIEELGHNLFNAMIEGAQQAQQVARENLLDLVVSFGYHMIGSRQFPLTMFIMLCEQFDLTPDKLYGLYLAKNALNKFRQVNGYKTGEYHKQWLVGGEFMEDNLVLPIILQAIEDDLTYERLTSEMTIHYDAF